jgi:hypothetical protein
MSNRNTVWLRPPHGEGEPQEFEATPNVIVPRMIQGWTQCEPPESAVEVTKNVDD